LAEDLLGDRRRQRPAVIIEIRGRSTRDEKVTCCTAGIAANRLRCTRNRFMLLGICPVIRFLNVPMVCEEGVLDMQIKGIENCRRVLLGETPRNGVN
jgi:hypothetical protein